MGKMVDRLSEIYDFIEAYKAKAGYSPALEDIAGALNVDKSAVYHHLETMESLGMIVRPRGMLRAIKLLTREPSWNQVVTEP
jgi:DNA-binding MarR family transcriptional regulator